LWVLSLLALVAIVVLPGEAGVARADGGTTVNFSYTGALQTWTVPAGVTSVRVTADGAQGDGTYGGLGGRVTATLSVTPGSTLSVYVGGRGSGATGGFNGGGGGNPYGGSPGGGASDIRTGAAQLADRVLVAGGGGGQARDATAVAGMGGSGGGLVGEAGADEGLPGGGGGTQTAGGAWGGGLYGTGGSLGQGGGGTYHGGDGGGGYYGGGAGGGDTGGEGGGGGGSSYAAPSAVNVSYWRGFHAGDGDVSITYPPSSDSVTPTPGSMTFSYTGAPQQWTVPAGVTTLQVKAVGAQGGGTYGGYGALVNATISVVPGQLLTVFVGGQGSGASGGFNGGGGGNPYGGEAGGGASDIRAGGLTLADRVVVAGGGGGASKFADSIAGGGGSAGRLGEAGAAGGGPWAGGGGGTQTAGGAWGGGLYGSGGSLGQGGGGTYQGGDGGGGYYGGGAGGGDTNGGPGGGGAGSSYARLGSTGVTFIAGARRGDGQVVLTWPPPAPTVPSSSSTTVNFAYTGAPQYWTVPDGVNMIAVSAAGGQGGTGVDLGAGGLGGLQQGVVPVTPGQIVTVMVGGAGSAGAGFNGGGGGNPYGGGPGGGASDVRVGGAVLTDRMLVAGGGGGGAANSGPAGGGGGGLSGQPGGNGSLPGGGGGTQTAGGAWGGGYYGSSGSLGQGGGGTYHGGDGGGGYYGGGAGGGDINGSGGGGGGSSYAAPSVNQAATQAAVNSGNGSVTIYTGSNIPGNTPLANSETLGGDNPSEPGVADSQDVAGDGVNTFTGSFSKSFTDLQIPGRGLPLDLERTYNSAAASVLGIFGYGWTFSYGISLAIGQNGTQATITQENGSQVVFTQTAGGSWVAAPRVQASLVQNQNGTWTFTRGNTVTYTFNSSGQLTAETDLNGYATTLSYTSGQLTTITDPALRTFTFSYWPSGLVHTVSDSGGRTVNYAYTNNDLTSVVVTDVPNNRETDFTYYTGHLLWKLLDPNQVTLPPQNQHPLTNVYTNGQLTSQTDPMLRVTQFDYTAVPNSTVVTEQDGSKVLDAYSGGQLSQQTIGYQTSSPAITPYTYDPANLQQTSQTDPNNHVTVNSYDAQGNSTGSTDPLGNTATAAYNALGEPLTTVDASGITTAYTYDAAGNVQTKKVTGAGGSPVETTQYVYDPTHPGDLTQVTDPAGYVTDYHYDGYGDRDQVTTHPDANSTNTTKMVFDVLGRMTCRASANATAANVVCPAPGGQHVSNTTSWTYDNAGHVKSMTDAENNPATAYDYDANGNLLQTTDPAGNITKNAYDFDDELTDATVGYSTSSAATTHYDYLLVPQAGGTCSSSVASVQSCNSVTDPKGNVTVDYFDALGQKIKETEPAAGDTTYTYDAAGNLKTETTAAGTSTFGYDSGDRQTSISYSNNAAGYAAAPNVTYTYDAAGKRTSMTDGTGTTTYQYDNLERLTSVTNGAGSTVGYAYNNDDVVTDITYPGTNTVHYGFDTAGDATSVNDWLGHPATTFGYDRDSNLTSEVLPTAPTTTTSTIGFNNDDQLTSISDAPTGQTAFATFGYTRNTNRQVGTENNTGVPAPTSQTYGYDPLTRLKTTSSGDYAYNVGGDPIKLANGTTQDFTTPHRLTTASSPISLVGQNTNASTGTTSLQVQMPTGVTIKANDLILLSVTCAATSTPNTPSGYTLVNTYTSGTASSSDKIALYRRTAQGGDGAVTVTFGSRSAVAANVVIYRGVSTTSPIDVIDKGTASSGTTVTAPSITTTVATDQLLLVEGANYGGHTAGSFTQPSGFTQRSNVVAGTQLTATIADKPLTTAGPTNSQQVNFSVSSGGLVAVILALKPAQTTYGYNSRGDRTSITGPTGTVTNLTYDQLDRLTAYGASATYIYNGDGLRMSKTVSGNSEAFTWDSNNSTGVPRPLVDGTTSCVYDPLGRPLEQISSGGTVMYYLHDQIGSTRLLRSSSGSTVASYTYDAYGTMVGSTGSASNPLGYVGAYTDSESGAIYLINRYYDPSAAVFLTVDPIVNSTNQPFNYAGQDPINNYDLDGTCVCVLKRAENGVTKAISWAANKVTYAATAVVLGTKAIARRDVAIFGGGTASVATKIRAMSPVATLIASGVASAASQAVSDAIQNSHLSLKSRVGRAFVAGVLGAATAAVSVAICGPAAPGCAVVISLAIGQGNRYVASYVDGRLGWR
jgi:RHS repeat-associated protein